MNLPIEPPFPPMLARLSRELPGDTFIYEPKWDGFRCLVFADETEVDLRSRNQRSLTRYFPELVAALESVGGRFVLDGEIIVLTSEGADFDALLQRLHPAERRIERLARDTPASFIAFDLLAHGDDELTDQPSPDVVRCWRICSRPKARLSFSPAPPSSPQMPWSGSN